MTKRSITKMQLELRTRKTGSFLRPFSAMLVALAVAISAAMTGCETPQAKAPASPDTDRSDAIILREGDVLKISFPGASNLDSTQPIRRDGKIALTLVGEVDAVGMTPAELEQEILKRYSSQLVTKEVTVTVESSSFPVFVSGAVIRPERILSDHPITALEAIMEAGGFDYKVADLGHVRVVRNEGARTRNYTLNLKSVLQGRESAPFYLRPSDIIYVPEKFSWF